MPKDTASDLLHTNREYEKLKTKHGDTDYTPRETPGQQGPGGRGYDKALHCELDARGADGSPCAAWRSSSTRTPRTSP